MAVAGRFAFEIDDGHAPRVGLHPRDFFLGELADVHRTQPPARTGEKRLGDADGLVPGRRIQRSLVDFEPQAFGPYSLADYLHVEIRCGEGKI